MRKFSKGVTDMKKMVWLGVMVLGLGCLGATFPTGEFVVVGRACNYNFEAMGESDGVVLELARGDGAVVAQCGVADPDERGYNFRLCVPMGSANTGACVKYGEKLTLVARQGGKPSSISLESVTAGAANSAMAADVVFATYSDPAQKVPDEYIEDINAMILYNWDVTGGKWDPDADWDGDGFSNYAEYVAGTDPFDATDMLRVTEISSAKTEGGEARLAVTFEYAGGRIYGVEGAEELGAATEPQVFSTENAAGAAERTSWISENGGAGVKTFWMKPVAEGPKSMFYRITVKDPAAAAK